MTPTLAIGLSLLLPALGAFAIAAADSRPNLRETITVLVALALAATVATLLPGVMAGERPELYLGELLPGISIAFKVEPLGMLYACLASGLWIVNSIYSIGYMRGNSEKHQTRFYVCFAIALAAVMGIAFAENLVTLFLFYEILTLSTYPLVAHKGDSNTIASARVYLGILLATSVGLLLPAIIWTYSVADTVSFVPGGILTGSLTGPGVASALCSMRWQW
jgi:multicomponent Na+:H+ antiporter subunit D